MKHGESRGLIFLGFSSAPFLLYSQPVGWCSTPVLLGLQLQDSEVVPSGGDGAGLGAERPAYSSCPQQPVS